jgi:uncharacterized lipoprotein YbaY
VTIVVDVLADPAGGELPPPGTPVHVELRDTSVADAAAVVVASADTVVAGTGPQLATVRLPAAHASSRLTVWAHADVTRSGDVSVGDYVTTQSHPVPSGELQPARLPVTLRRVR